MGDEDRPIQVWAILIYSALVTLAWLYFAMSLSEGEMSAIGYMGGLVTVGLYLAAAITLFLMRKMAFYFFLGAIFLEFVLLLSGAGSRVEVLMVGGDSAIVLEMVNLLISAFLCGYVIMLNKENRLY